MFRCVPLSELRALFPGCRLELERIGVRPRFLSLAFRKLPHRLAWPALELLSASGLFWTHLAGAIVMPEAQR